MREFYLTRRMRIVLACVITTVISGGYYLIGLNHFSTGPYWYLFWNLGLAWIPLGLSLLLERVLRTRLWSSWPAIIVTSLWLIFFPNAFYIITDFYHLAELNAEDLMHNTAMFFMFIQTGVIVGFMSLYIVHKELLKRLRARTVNLLLAAILLMSGFAIHLGHDLRWNTWDVITRPASLLFDISERLLHPAAHPQTYETTLTFFVLFGSTYFLLYQFARSSAPPPGISGTLRRKAPRR
jgi:uncharacterized membrane protein